MAAAVDSKKSTKLSSAIECPVCRDTFRDPRMLPCGHTFCRRCLEKIAADQRISCPTCRVQHSAQPHNLPVNYLVNHLHELTLDEPKKKRTTKMNEQEIEKSLAETDLAVIRLAFCNATAAMLGELSQKATQAAAQVDTEIIRKIRDMIKKGTANATILAAVKQINETALHGCHANDVLGVLGRVQKIGTELARITIGKSTLGKPDKERKYIATVFSALMRFADIQQCADYIVAELHKSNSSLSMLTCMIGNACGWRVRDESASYIFINGILGKRVIIYCGSSSTKLKVAPRLTAVETMLSKVCGKFDGDANCAMKVSDALSEHFPGGWNCAEVVAGKELVISFQETDFQHLLRFECTSKKCQFIVWAWKV